MSTEQINDGFEDGMLIINPQPETPTSSETQSLSPQNALLTGRGRYLEDSILLNLMTTLFTGRIKEAEDLSRVLHTRFGSLAGTLTATDRELGGIKNMGAHMLPMLRVLQESALRYNHARLPPEDILGSERQLLDYLTARLSRENIEQFRILFLNEKKSLIADEAQARGTVNHTPVYPREVARRAVEIGASGLVLVHNHPSGDPTPSEADLQMTQQVRAALEVVGIEVIDHLIIGNGCHTSFRRNGFL